MNTFIEKVEENLAQFTPFEAEQAAVFGNYFAKNEANVSFFIDEIRHTAAILMLKFMLKNCSNRLTLYKKR